MHVTLDGQVTENHRVLYHERSLEGFMHLAALVLGMSTIGGPFIIRYPAGNGTEAGLSGVLFIAESNITVHTYPEYNYIYMDFFSCKEVPLDAIAYIKGHLGLTRSVQHIMPDRGRTHLEVAHGSR